MKKLKTILILTLCALILSCSREDDPPADPRLAFIGNFQSNEHDVKARVTGTEPKVVPVHGGINLTVKLSPGYPEALEIDLKELVTEVIGTFPVESFSVEFDHLPLALISGNSFELKSTEFILTTITETSIGTLDAKGNINGEMLTLEYEFRIPAQNNQLLIYESNESVELEKQ